MPSVSTTSAAAATTPPADTAAGEAETAAGTSGGEEQAQPQTKAQAQAEPQAKAAAAAATPPATGAPVTDANANATPPTLMHLAIEVAGQRMLQTHDVHGLSLGVDGTRDHARVRVQTIQEAAKVIALALLLEERTLLYDEPMCQLLRRISTEYKSYLPLMPGVLIVTVPEVRLDGLSSLILKVSLTPPDAYGRRPLRFGLEVVSSTLGLLGETPALHRVAARIQRNPGLIPPTLPEFVGERFHSTLPVTVCYGIDRLQPVDEHGQPVPASIAQANIPLCHSVYSPGRREGASTRSWERRVGEHEKKGWREGRLNVLVSLIATDTDSYLVIPMASAERSSTHAPLLTFVAGTAHPPPGAPGVTADTDSVAHLDMGGLFIQPPPEGVLDAAARARIPPPPHTGPEIFSTTVRGADCGTSALSASR